MNMNAQDNVSPSGHLATSAYNPYNGRECLDIIMKRIYQTLKDHQDFASHITYTKFEFEFSLYFKSEAITPTTVKGKQSYELREAEKGFTVTGTSAPAPDDGRREAGLVVPAPVLTAGGMVDIPLQVQVADVK